MPRWNLTPLERLCSKCIVNDNGCIEWTGYIRPDGYGETWLNKKLILTHRLSWVLVYGPIPDELVVRHSEQCKKVCVNPNHLQLGTRADNNGDMMRFDEGFKGKYPRGVSYHKQRDKYQVHIRLNGKQTYVGLYETVDEAYEAYKKAAIANNRFFVKDS